MSSENPRSPVHPCACSPCPGGLCPPERLATFLPSIGAAEADVLERMIVQGQQGAALPPPLCPTLQSQQQVLEGRRAARPGEECEMGQGDHGPAPCQDDGDARNLDLVWVS